MANTDPRARRTTHSIRPSHRHAIQARVDELDDIHGYFFRLHHPDRERFERDGWPEGQEGGMT